MRRFRKKSDGKRTVSVLTSDHEQNLEPLDVLPEIPLTNDFRSSLILPDLSRRFSLLRSVGDPLLLDQLRSRLADQRTRGAENQISEEEEEMFLDTLERIRPKNAQSTSQDTTDEGETTRNSIKSSSSSSVSSSPSSRSTKRYSNNLFGSGRLRDYTYFKNVTSSRGSTTSSAHTTSLTPTEASEKTVSLSSFRPVTPDASSNPSSVQSSPNEKGPIRSTPVVPSSPSGEQQLQAITAAEYRLHKTLGPSVLKRASMALDEAIREIEDEVEDEILLPRSVPAPRGSLDQPTAEVRHSTSSIFEGGVAISIDQTIHDEFSERRASPVPARTVPGYVPGMPRPMTPRDVEFDEQRSHSTTPRAQSPYVDPPPSSPTPTGTSTKLRRGSSSSTSKSSSLTPVPAAPLFLQRSTNGRYTPDDSHRSGDIIEFDSPLNSSLLGRRKPASPLSGQPYQPMGVSTRPSSRPSTPSNVIWVPNPNNAHKNNHSIHSIHSRNNSWTVEGLLNNSDVFGSLTNQSSSPRSLRSPPPDSQTTEFDPTSISPQAYIPEPFDFAPRSGTPTQNARPSPISPSFSNFELSSRNGSRRSSRQNPPSSPFNISSLGFSPRANSSRSSLDSVGSSFHSWDEGDKVFNLFSDPREKQPAVWHDFDADKSSLVTPSGFSSTNDEDWDPEEIIKRYAGLGKADIVAIQEKLVTAAFAKIANTDPRDRAPSSMRRRRPSTSQSSYPIIACPPPQVQTSVSPSPYSRIASPPPQVQNPASSLPYPSDEQTALLNSMIESIKVQHTISLDTTPAVSTPDDKEISPSTRRNRDLAQVLFGDDETKEEPTTATKEPAQSTADPEPFVIPNITPSLPTIPSSPPPLVGESSSATPLTSPSPYLLTRNPSLPRLPQKPKEEADLTRETREVQQKAEAAMIALKKDPSKVNLMDTLKRTPSARKRIDPTQISAPRLVSASTSVDTIPLRTPSISSNTTSGASKLGSRLKRLRGSLRAKNVSTSDEPVVQDSKQRPSQIAYNDPAKLNVSGDSTVSSAPKTGRFKVPIPTPPASTVHGLKGFMARFRNRQRVSEMPSQRSVPRASSPLSQVSPILPTALRQTDTPLAKSNASIISERSLNSITPRPAGQARPMYSRFPPANPVSATVSPPTSTSTSSSPLQTLNDSQSAAALEQLYAAANDLGVDQDALHDLLARSGSTSSRNLLARNNSIQTTSQQLATTELSERTITAQQIGYVASTSSDQTATPTSYGPQSSDQRSNYIASDNERVTSSEDLVPRKSSIRKPDHLRRPKEGQTDMTVNPVVRRTIIYASDSGLSATEFAAMIQRKNSSRRRRISANSISNRSVHDRVPTPPPPKTPGARRFSADGMPPIPQVPTSLGQAMNANTLSSAGGPIEKSNSTHDSLYEMYAGESRVSSMVPVDPNGPVDQQNSKAEQGAADSGPALEVIQLANGETIWSIVNGLRDADDESLYTGRTSFASEYSTREPGSDGGSISAKEHGRTGSKSSALSFASKKKLQQGKVRPETKVFHSSSAQIGRLIESLSQGVDSGSFNILPNTNRGPGHSASSSLSTNDINWTVEERLDRMLGAINNSNNS